MRMVLLVLGMAFLLVLPSNGFGEEVTQVKNSVVKIPSRAMAPLFEYYQKEFTWGTAHALVQQLKAGNRVTINGVTIVKGEDGEADIHVPESALANIKMWFARDPNSNVGEYYIGNFPVSALSRSISQWVRSLMERKVAMIQFRTESKGKIQVIVE